PLMVTGLVLETLCPLRSNTAPLEMVSALAKVNDEFVPDAFADRLKVVVPVMLAIVAPAGMLAPVTDWPTTMPAVHATLTAALPLEVVMPLPTVKAPSAPALPSCKVPRATLVRKLDELAALRVRVFVPCLVSVERRPNVRLLVPAVTPVPVVIVTV